VIDGVSWNGLVCGFKEAAGSADLRVEVSRITHADLMQKFGDSTWRSLLQQQVEVVSHETEGDNANEWLPVTRCDCRGREQYLLFDWFTFNVSVIRIVEKIKRLVKPHEIILLSKYLAPVDPAIEDVIITTRIEWLAHT